MSLSLTGRLIKTALGNIGCGFLWIEFCRDIGSDRGLIILLKCTDLLDHYTDDRVGECRNANAVVELLL